MRGIIIVAIAALALAVAAPITSAHNPAAVDTIQNCMEKEEHRIHIEPYVGTVSSFFIASCNCGWIGSDWRSEEKARAEFENHAAGREAGKDNAGSWARPVRREP
jgi:hypothetical protein